MAKKRVNKKTGSLLSTALIIIVCAVWLLINSTSDDNGKAKPAAGVNTGTEVHFVDVGQGDATLVTSGNQTMLIDTGERDDSNTLIHYLGDMGIKSLDYLIITHPHTDHMGEASEIINQFDTENIIMPRTGSNVPTTSIYSTFIKTVKKQNKKTTAAKDSEFSFGEMKVILYTAKEEHSDLNNYSVLVKLVHGDNSFLITGDCESEEEKEMISQGFDLSADVLKAGHHGGATSSSAAFLKSVRPQYAVVSCGKDNMYGHPHEQAVKRLKKYADYYYCTMNNGTVTFISDGKGLTVETEK